MRRAPALNISLSRVPERQGAPRSVLGIDRHAHDLMHGRRRVGLLRRDEAQVREDLLDGYLVVAPVIVKYRDLKTEAAVALEDALG